MRFRLPEMRELGLQGMRFHLGGDTCHTACLTMELLEDDLIMSISLSDRWVISPYKACSGFIPWITIPELC